MSSQNCSECGKDVGEAPGGADHPNAEVSHMVCAKESHDKARAIEDIKREYNKSIDEIKEGVTFQPLLDFIDGMKG